MACAQPTVALLPWGNLIEDFLDTIGVSLESFCEEFVGSYMFGYVDALQRAGVRTVLICVSARVRRPARFTHRPTGATIHVLPALGVYRAIQRKMKRPRGPYARNVCKAFGEVHGIRVLSKPVLGLINQVVLHLTTPPRLLGRVLRDEGCTAILCQEYEYPRFDVCVLIGRLLRLPVFATFQGGDYQRKRLERFTRPLAIRFCDGLIIATLSEARRVQQLYGVPPRKIARVFNPVDADLWKPGDREAARARLGIPCSAKVAAWHGRVSIRKKGLDVLLDAWNRVCAESPSEDLRLILIGSGEDSDRFRREVEGWPPNRILWIERFLHDRGAIRDLLAAADVYAFPSRHEGFPVALVEAMACGLPVVAAAANGVADIVDGEEQSGGVIVPREDAAAFACALDRLLHDLQWSRSMGERARRRIEARFSPSSVGQQLREFLCTPCSRTAQSTTSN